MAYISIEYKKSNENIDDERGDSPPLCTNYLLLCLSAMTLA